MMASDLDLNTIFQAVTQQLSEKKEKLNEADTYNHNHGDNMVQIFGLAQKAIAEQADKPVSEQLNYAGKVVEQNVHSGSAALYAQGLTRASENLKGASLSPDMMSVLVQSLLGTHQPTPQARPQPKKGLLASLLASFLGKKQSQSSDQQLGLDDLLQLGQAFMQGQQGEGGLSQSALQALLSGSPMGESEHRKESGSLVASTLMNFVQSLSK
jgi:hypothetical protein